MWHAYLFQTTTGQIGPRIEVESATWSMSLNDAETFTLDVLKSSLPKTEPQWFSPWWAGVLLMYKDVAVCAGPILSFPQEDRTKLKISAKGIRRVLADRILVEELSNWATLPKSFIGYSGISLGTIAKRAVQHVTTAKPGSSLPITYAVQDELASDAPKIPAGLPACMHEDGSRQAADGSYYIENCYWNASTRGNGIGQSYAFVNGEQIMASQNDHERTYRGFNVSNISVDQVLTKLSEVTRGPDIMFKPRVVDDKRLTFDMWTGTDRDPHIEQKYSPFWDITAEKSDVTQFSLTETAAYQASRVFSTGAGQDESKLMSVSTNTTPLMAGYPLLEKVISSDTETPAVVYQQGLNALYKNEDSLQEITMTVRADGDIPMGHFWPGDSVQLVIAGMVNVPDGIHKARLLNMSGTLSTNIRLALQLEK